MSDEALRAALLNSPKWIEARWCVPDQATGSFTWQTGRHLSWEDFLAILADHPVATPGRGAEGER